MVEINVALEEVARMRQQLAGSTRFQGFAPAIVAASGGMALLLGAYEAVTAPDLGLFLLHWILLAIICVLLISTEAVVRSRRLHRAMAQTMMSTSLRRFLPSGMAGAAIAFVFYSYIPDSLRILPGIWQILLAVGICSALDNLPTSLLWAAVWYFLAGLCVLTLIGMNRFVSPWMMALPFGGGQFLVAALLYLDARKHGRGEHS
jgi:hypothetical protein